MPDDLKNSPYLDRPVRSLAEVQNLRSPEWPHTRSLRVPPKGTPFDLEMEDRRREAIQQSQYRSDHAFQRQPETPRSVCQTRQGLLRRARAKVQEAIRAHRQFVTTQYRLYSARQQREWEIRLEANIAGTFAAYKVHRGNLADAVEWAAKVEAKWEAERFATYERALAGEDR